MFKYLLHRGLSCIQHIFNDQEAPSAKRVQQAVAKVNLEAEAIWNRGELPFRTRFRECHRITLPALKLVFPASPGRYKGVGPSTWERLDGVFLKHYENSWLSIGWADDAAYEVQNRYMHDVADVLGLECEHFRSRAIALLGMVYGHTAVPLLTKASVEAMWEICSSPFYKRQLSLVRSISTYMRSPF
jgi:hypothetical protein